MAVTSESRLTTRLARHGATALWSIIELRSPSLRVCFSIFLKFESSVNTTVITTKVL